jgi:hypothetical protein
MPILIYVNSQLLSLSLLPLFFDALHIMLYIYIYIVVYIYIYVYNQLQRQQWQQLRPRVSAGMETLMMRTLIADCVLLCRDNGELLCCFSVERCFHKHNSLRFFPSSKGMSSFQRGKMTDTAHQEGDTFKYI